MFYESINGSYFSFILFLFPLCAYDTSISKYLSTLLQLISGNVNTYTPRKSTLEAPFVASKVRFFPFAAHPRTACMRVELYGCRWKRRYNRDTVYDGWCVPGQCKATWLCCLWNVCSLRFFVQSDLKPPPGGAFTVCCLCRGSSCVLRAQGGRHAGNDGRGEVRGPRLRRHSPGGTPNKWPRSDDGLLGRAQRFWTAGPVRHKRYVNFRSSIFTLTIGQVGLLGLDLFESKVYLHGNRITKLAR